MPRRSRSTDLSPRDFRNALIDHGFAFLGRSLDRYVDIRHRKVGRYLDAVLDGRGRIRRRETLQALLAARKGFEAEEAAALAKSLRQAGIAAAIAPVALTPCRADLSEEAAIAQLADDFLLGVTASEHITFASLLQKGWRPEQLKQYGPAARIVADRRQVLELNAMEVVA